MDDRELARIEDALRAARAVIDEALATIAVRGRCRHGQRETIRLMGQRAIERCLDCGEWIDEEVMHGSAGDRR